MLQGGEGVKAPGVATQGGSIDVSVGPNDDSVEVHAGGQGQTHQVPPGKKVTVPVPPVPPGTVLTITVGKGLRTRILYVEVIAPSP